MTPFIVENSLLYKMNYYLYFLKVNNVTKIQNTINHYTITTKYRIIKLLGKESLLLEVPRKSSKSSFSN